MFDFTVWELFDLRGYMVSPELLHDTWMPPRAKMAAMSTNGNDFFNMFFILLSYFQVVILFRSFYSKVQRYKKIENGNKKCFFTLPITYYSHPFVFSFHILRNDLEIRSTYSWLPMFH